MPETYVNIHGRKPGRGIRPWVLLPKVIFVAFYLGGLAAACTVWLMEEFASNESSDPRRLWTINLVGSLIEFFVVPALLGTILTGVALLLQHPRQFIRMRWMVVKLVSLAILIPAGHFFLSSRLLILRNNALQQTSESTAAMQFTCGLLVVLAGSIWVVVLGRLKPRLKQNWARGYAASQRPADDSTAAP